LHRGRRAGMSITALDGHNHHASASRASRVRIMSPSTDCVDARGRLHRSPRSAASIPTTDCIHARARACPSSRLMVYRETDDWLDK
jgi:hypothetical protein